MVKHRVENPGEAETQDGTDKESWEHRLLLPLYV